MKVGFILSFPFIFWFLLLAVIQKKFLRFIFQCFIFNILFAAPCCMAGYLIVTGITFLALMYYEVILRLRLFVCNTILFLLATAGLTGFCVLCIIIENGVSGVKQPKFEQYIIIGIPGFLFFLALIIRWLLSWRLTSKTAS
jgi:hypothetical protein